MRVDPDLVWMAVAVLVLVLVAPALVVSVRQKLMQRRGPQRINLSWRRRRRR